jgi:hypothetical protein
VKDIKRPFIKRIRNEKEKENKTSMKSQELLKYACIHQLINSVPPERQDNIIILFEKFIQRCLLKNPPPDDFLNKIVGMSICELIDYNNKVINSNNKVINSNNKVISSSSSDEEKMN